MPDVPRTRPELVEILADNKTGDITPQDMRDWLESQYLATEVDEIAEDKIDKVPAASAGDIPLFAAGGGLQDSTISLVGSTLHLPDVSAGLVHATILESESSITLQYGGPFTAYAIQGHGECFSVYNTTFDNRRVWMANDSGVMVLDGPIYVHEVGETALTVIGTDGSISAADTEFQVDVDGNVSAASFTAGGGNFTVDGGGNLTVADAQFGPDLFINSADGELTASAVLASSITASGQLQANRNGLGTVSTLGLLVNNNTLATSGAQVQLSPRMQFQGYAWKSNAIAAAQSQAAVLELLPIAGAASTSSTLRLGFSNNGAAVAYPFGFRDSGAIDFGSAVGDKLLLWGTTYGIGISAGEHVIWADTGQKISFRASSRTGTEWASLNASGLSTTGVTLTGEINSSSTANSGTAFVGGGIRRRSINTPLNLMSGGTTATGTFNSIVLDATVDGAWTQTSGTLAGVKITTNYNQASGTASNTDLLIARTSAATGSGAQYAIRATDDGIDRFSVSNSGAVACNSVTATNASLNSLSMGAADLSVTIQGGQFYVDCFSRGFNIGEEFFEINGGGGDITFNGLAVIDGSGNVKAQSLHLYDIPNGAFVPVASVADGELIFEDGLSVNFDGLNVETTLSAQTVASTLQYVNERASTPSDPTANNQANVYMKGDKYIVSYNDGGTMKYRYMTLNSTDAAWTYTTSAP